MVDDKDLEEGGRSPIRVVFWCCLQGRGTKRIVAIAGVVSEIRTEEHPNTHVQCYHYSSSLTARFRVNTYSSPTGLPASPPTLTASYINYLQPQHKTWNQLHRQLVPLWCNVGMTDMTHKLITRTTGNCSLFFWSPACSSCNAEDQKLPAFNRKKEPTVSSTKLKRLSKILFTPPDGQQAKYHYV
jgi:hypothetical protein